MASEGYAQAYRKFNDCIEEGNIDEACRILRENEFVINILMQGVSETLNAYGEIRKKDILEADYFKKLILEKYQEIEEGFHEIDRIVWGAEAGCLEKSLRINSKYKKILVEMAENARKNGEMDIGTDYDIEDIFDPDGEFFDE